MSLATPKTVLFVQLSDEWAATTSRVLTSRRTTGLPPGRECGRAVYEVKAKKHHTCRMTVD
ncbi:hypothetical protein PC129_g9005 [Phytophthora cactorum]|uniref:Uncharacterized protein n=1 Tax=Phytophthora cactorum TaxID=29920 RepID=A0A329SSZ8_9STRA|nr:hypothetical protein Pcac1_g25436 [Phytophthora cactorum]KAG2803135.1 hypothetical protein PC111_g18813 [Phytophthora cactorum]KAG2822386.1 hypothetical protein PC112_g10960 [Phytophthora cactorum]KAG2856534.1 hypothetical protein PC113_g11494 [Phytophthora cactorum]KAG2888842.1 hypothetical protein PC114_g18233 [Phytophthora cactorum]